MRTFVLLLAVLALCGFSSLALGENVMDVIRGNPLGEQQTSPGHELVSLIKTTIEPDSWHGDRTIAYRRGFLVVVHRRTVHRQIEKLINALRAATGPPSK